ncbi:TIGR03862 family flavoprotein [bacterium]|nr:TIGR03862 family flavoprotein [bacterium]
MAEQRAVRVTRAAIFGAGAAGLAAADVLSAAGVRTTVFERSANPARKVLLAGRGGLNLTHSEPIDAFLGRYGAAGERLEPMIRAFSPDALRAWCADLGVETFVGSSGRVFPVVMKASPFVRAMLSRLALQGAELVTRARWIGLDETGASMVVRDGGDPLPVAADVTVLAFGGASWPRLGSDGAWSPALEAAGVSLEPFAPANSGFLIDWSDHVRERFAGAPVKPVSIGVEAGGAVRWTRGEAIITRDGIEGGAIYEAGAMLRAQIATRGRAAMLLDLHPDIDAATLTARLERTPRGASLSTRLRKAGLSPPSIALVREAEGPVDPQPAALASRIKAVRLATRGPFAIERAISSAGGVRWDALSADLELLARPGVFVAGEMVDWEAPTGGYLLQASFAMGRWAARGALGRLRN